MTTPQPTHAPRKRGPKPINDNDPLAIVLKQRIFCERTGSDHEMPGVAEDECQGCGVKCGIWLKGPSGFIERFVIFDDGVHSFRKPRRGPVPGTVKRPDVTARNLAEPRLDAFARNEGRTVHVRINGMVQPSSLARLRDAGASLTGPQQLDAVCQELIRLENRA
jgi:hypothetical protein